jgi:cytochrome oxidase assembly protein ShyY1
VRFLFTRRWLGFFFAVVALAFLAVRLGDWQFHRLDERRAANRLITHNLRDAPVPVTDVLAVGRGAHQQDEWRKVTATGTWDDEHTVVVRYRTRNEAAGVDVVTPLVTSSGDAVLVDRGWMAADNNGSTRPHLPRPTTGKVTVTGYVRVDATGGSTTVDNLSTRAISSSAIAKVVPDPLYGGFLLQVSQAPRATDGLGAPELPEIDDGPHFFYGLQWWFFGLLAVVGFGYLAYDEWRQRRRPSEGSAPGASEGAERPAVDREHHAAHE